ncbi:conserved expressed protein [Plakobranchus ocellatus]|uniref:Conserved expressed protein n=1 Tax=Plakobranchus ocellatus TaxID=259542 RepID=A0AAV4BM03_9GAST|nr:conserved expressed protein [Plakobranchus ocellatus]
MVWTRSNLPWPDSNRFTFVHYLSALSALYVAGATTLVIHGDIEPRGTWWDRLLEQHQMHARQPGRPNRTNEKMKVPHNNTEQKIMGLHNISVGLSNASTSPHKEELIHHTLSKRNASPEISERAEVTKQTDVKEEDSDTTSKIIKDSYSKNERRSTYGTVYRNSLEKSTSGKTVLFINTAAEPLDSIFQQEVVLPAHRSDIMRLLILLKHGGIYQDRDVIWTRRIPTFLRRYPAVACNDWPRYGEWPASFNIGVMMARPNAEYLKQLLESFRYYRDDKWEYNAILMPYKVYERNPELLYVDKYLQTTCFRNICHPTWHIDYIRSVDDMRQIDDFRWWQTRSLHFTKPKTPPSLASLDALRSATDMEGQVARMVLRASGQAHLLD